MRGGVVLRIGRDPGIALGELLLDLGRFADHGGIGQQGFVGLLVTFQHVQQEGGPKVIDQVVGTFHLLEATRDYWNGLTEEKKISFRFLHVSTDEVYGSLSKDDPAFVLEFPSRLFGVSSTVVEGEYGFGDVAYERTSFALREEGKEWVGTASALWGITAGVYLALMGPQGMREIGESILQRTAYAIKKLQQVPGVEIRFGGMHFKDFTVDFNGSGQTVAAIHKKLLEKGIFGGKDLSAEFPVLGQCALYAVTEIHSQADIDRLAATLQEVLK